MALKQTACYDVKEVFSIRASLSTAATSSRTHVELMLPEGQRWSALNHFYMILIKANCCTGVQRFQCMRDYLSPAFFCSLHNDWECGGKQMEKSETKPVLRYVEAEIEVPLKLNNLFNFGHNI